MQREGDQGRPAPDFDKAKSELSERLQEETQSATRLIHDASDEVVNKAGKYASEAQEALSGKAQETQRDMSASLAAFGARCGQQVSIWPTAIKPPFRRSCLLPLVGWSASRPLCGTNQSNKS